MPNTKSAKKELRKGKKLSKINSGLKTGLRKSIKLSRKLIEAKDAGSEEAVKKTLREIDKAAKKGIIKKNAQNRKKSRLHKRLNAIKKEKIEKK